MAENTILHRLNRILTINLGGSSYLFKAGAAGMAGTVLGVPLFGRLTISRRGLYSQGGVAPTWWRSIDVNVVHACSSKRPAAHISLSWNFLTSCLPDSFFYSEPSL